MPNSTAVQEVVITGVGIACPLGIGRAAVGAALENAQSGVRVIPWLEESGFPISIGGEVPGFEPKQYVKPRKSLKVMCREIQLAFASAELAWQEAQLEEATIDPERLGVVAGTSVYRSELDEMTALYQKTDDQGRFDFSRWGEGMKELYPLWMLKYLPNMAACQVGIAKDARGPNNTIVQGDVSSLVAIIEAHDAIARGHADVMIAGAASSMLQWIDLMWHKGCRVSPNVAEPASACRPFDAGRNGMVCSEGAAMFVLESRAHAQRRNAPIFANILGYARRCEPVAASRQSTGSATRLAIQTALDRSGVPATELGHVNAHGVATVEDDACEAQAIREVLGNVPVTAPKSLMGNVGAGGGAVELACSLISMGNKHIPPTLNYQQPDPACPVNVVTSPQPTVSPTFLSLNQKITGQSVAMVLSMEG